MLGSKVFDPMIPTDFSAFHTLEILKKVDNRAKTPSTGYF